ncbi:hypothetical protein ACX16M_23280 [Bacillus cereus]|nr:hypothetical protein [Bacillus cereus]MDA2699065.1 hypothetical protein [Bacillus cereus]MDA2721196.1 hypothetical protein [Bacillus cereus]MDA2726581.1 hypothetical protein [Bacillus cereus]
MHRETYDKHKHLYEVMVKSLARKGWRFIVIPAKDEQGCVAIVELYSFLKQSAAIKEVDKNKRNPLKLTTVNNTYLFSVLILSN